SIVLNAVNAAAASLMCEGARKWSRSASAPAGFSQGDLFRICAARTTWWPARLNAATNSRTCTDAPLRPSTGTPRSGHKYRIFTEISGLQVVLASPVPSRESVNGADTARHNAPWLAPIRRASHARRYGRLRGKGSD